MNALKARFPDLALAWRSLGAYPTPVERVRAFGREVWVKRDDLAGGNKVRKLEWLLADALARGRRAVITVGGTGSNHVLATALHARALGLAHTHAVLFPQPPSDDVTKKGEAYTALAVRSGRVPAKIFVPFAAAARVVASLAAGDGVPYAIGPGGSSPLGTLGYVSAALELAAQIAAGELPVPDAIYVPLGSGGTAAGLLLGLRLAGLWSTRVVAVRVVPYPWTTGGGARRLASRTSRLLRDAGVTNHVARFRERDLAIVHDQLGPAYGASTPAADAAVARARDAGLTLETTYTGKALAALLADQARGRPPRAIFWNTYAPAMSVTISAKVSAR